MRKVVLLFMLALVGCKVEVPEWSSAPETHTCTVDQMTKVEKETQFCASNTSYSNSYCYNSAIMRNCTKQEKTPATKQASRNPS